MKQIDFDSLEMWITIEETKGLLNTAETDSPEESLEFINRVRFIASYALSFKDTVPAELFTSAMISTVELRWKEIFSDITGFNSSKNMDYLRNAVTKAEVSLEIMVRWPTSSIKSAALGQMTRAFHNFESELSSALERSNARLTLNLDESSLRETELTKNISELEKQVLVSKTQVENMEAKLTADEERLARALSEYSAAFAVAEKERETNLSDWLKQQADMFEVSVRPSLMRVQEIVGNSETNFKQIESLLVDSKFVAGLAVGDQLANRYKEWSTSERKTGYLTMKVGGGALLLGVGILIWIFADKTLFDTNSAWEAVYLKSGIIGLCAGGATVAFTLGSRSLRQVNSFKRMELELRAIGPFLANVPETDMAESKTEFLARAFGHAWTDTESRKSKPTEVEALAILIFDAIKAGAQFPKDKLSQ